MNVVILQPSYIPWRGFFHQIQKADIFVFYDDVQYDKHGWRNRNRIKTPQGLKWLTIPVHSKGNVAEQIPINQIEISWEKPWNQSHWSIIYQYYKSAPYFKKYSTFLEYYYQQKKAFLADFTIEFTIAIANELGITHTEFLRSSEIKATGTKTDRLLHILKCVGATHYISGPSAKNYLDESKLLDDGITLEYMDYSYPEYEQLYPPFEPFVSILDLLLMTGPLASKYIW